MLNTTAQLLRDNLNKLSDRDQQFAHSLLSSRAPSVKQQGWITTLAQRATAPASTPEQAAAATVANISGIVALIDRGHAKLKFPKIAFRAADMDLRLSLAGDRARHPGSINVTSSGGSEWFGRVHRDGRWEASPRIEQTTATAVMASLQAFAADPAGIARTYGRETGACCFCCKELTDPVSIGAGFGPICAENYGLDRHAEAKANRHAELLVA